MDTSSQQIFFSLKQILKAKNITYKELGKALQLSEAGVKKMFQTCDCSVSRMTAIGDFLGISLADLLNRHAQQIKEIELSKKQCEFLAAHPHFYNFYEKLASEKKSVAEITREYRLTENSVRKYLRQLEELGLLEAHVNDRVKIAHARPARIRVNHPKLTQLRIKGIVRFIESLRPTPQSYDLGTLHFKFTTITLKRFQLDLMELMEKYYHQSEIEQSLHPKTNLKDLNVVMAMGTNSLTGEIINL